MDCVGVVFKQNERDPLKRSTIIDQDVEYPDGDFESEIKRSAEETNCYIDDFESEIKRSAEETNCYIDDFESEMKRSAEETNCCIEDVEYPDEIKSCAIIRAKEPDAEYRELYNHWCG